MDAIRVNENTKANQVSSGTHLVRSDSTLIGFFVGGLKMANAATSLSRFEKLFIKNCCWIWIGDKNPQGYGIVRNKNGRREGAHRISYRFYRGNFPFHLQVCHKCDNSSCVNPDHLFLGTQKDNMIDMYRKGRNVRGDVRGEKNGRHKYTEKQVLKIRHLYQQGMKIVDIHKQFGGSYQSIWCIIRRKFWTHI